MVCTCEVLDSVCVGEGQSWALTRPEDFHLEQVPQSPEGLLEHRMLATAPRISDPAGLGLGLENLRF